MRFTSYFYFSADTWVPSGECPSSECPYKRFDEEKSSTYQPLNISFAINYAQGSVHGSYVKERMSLLGPDAITSPEQTIGLSRSANDIISGGMKMTSNGILGLAFPALAANSDTLEAYKPFLFELAAKKIISQPIFSISLNEKEGWQSELTIGGMNRDKFTGEIHYLPVVKNVNPKTAELDYTFWSVELKGIEIDQQNNKTSSLKVNQKVTLDTGTTYSYLSKALVDQIVQDVTQQKPSVDLSTQLYTVDCKLRSSNHTIQFEFDHLKISILLRDFILKPSNEESTQCALSLSYNYDENETFVLGDNFLRSAFFLFDMEAKKVGVATAINSSSKVFST